MRTNIQTLMLALFAVLLGMAAGTAGAEQELTAKGIYYDVDRYQRSGLKFRVELDDRGKSRRVPATYPFHSGDRFTFSFEINRDTYVYVINRTQTSAPATVNAGYRAKGTGEAWRLGEPRLLFPTGETGSNNRLTSNAAYAVPRRGYFVMDGESGIEKLYLVISDRPLDFGDLFDAKTGALRGASSSRVATLQDRVAALQTRRDRWQGNALVELVPKGIVHQVDSYGASVDATKPAVLEIDLKHYR